MTPRRFWLRLTYSLLLLVAVVLFLVGFLLAARLKDPTMLAIAFVGGLLLLTAVIVLAAIDLRGVAEASLRQQRDLERAVRDTLTMLAAKRQERPAAGEAAPKDPGNGRG